MASFRLAVTSPSSRVVTVILSPLPSPSSSSMYASAIFGYFTATIFAFAATALPQESCARTQSQPDTPPSGARSLFERSMRYCAS